MIAFWNRYEVYAGFDMNRFNQILDLLAAERVKYKFQTVRVGQSARSRGTTGMNLDHSVQYYIYVHKRDEEVADRLISQHLR
ncbi:MAG: hypothetical protein FWE12_03935 [Oscillospiraceae bacterium]|nr:hypothetical protein [Oscillospiraceae bacterium]